jgi:hypothetical protein
MRTFAFRVRLIPTFAKALDRVTTGYRTGNEGPYGKGAPLLLDHILAKQRVTWTMNLICSE